MSWNTKCKTKCIFTSFLKWNVQFEMVVSDVSFSVNDNTFEQTLKDWFEYIQLAAFTQICKCRFDLRRFSSLLIVWHIVVELLRLQNQWQKWQFVPLFTGETGQKWNSDLATPFCATPRMNKSFARSHFPFVKDWGNECVWWFVKRVRSLLQKKWKPEIHEQTVEHKRLYKKLLYMHQEWSTVPNWRNISLWWANDSISWAKAFNCTQCKWS